MIIVNYFKRKLKDFVLGIFREKFKEIENKIKEIENRDRSRYMDAMAWIVGKLDNNLDAVELPAQFQDKNPNLNYLIGTEICLLYKDGQTKFVMTVKCSGVIKTTVKDEFGNFITLDRLFVIDDDNVTHIVDDDYWTIID